MGRKELKPIQFNSMEDDGLLSGRDVVSRGSTLILQSSGTLYDVNN